MSRQENNAKRKTVMTGVVALLLFLVAFILLIIGGILMAEEDPKVRNYAHTICQVNSSNYRTYRCTTRYSSYTCYGPIWYVHFQLNDQMINTIVEQDERYKSYTDALNKVDKYEINGNYSCWYNRRDPTVAQWTQPNNLPGIIVLSCCGLSILLDIICCVISARKIRTGMQVEIEMEPDSVPPPIPFNPSIPIPPREFTRLATER